MPGELMYRIIDEPSDSPLRQFAVSPFWPWLALSLTGAWLGVPWFIVNALAIGSPTKAKEIALALLTPVLMLGAFLAASFVMSVGDFGFTTKEEQVGWMVLPLSAVKIIAGYVLFTWQMRAAELHAHFGNPLKNGVFVLLIGRYFSEPVLSALPWFVKVGLL